MWDHHADSRSETARATGIRTARATGIRTTQYPGHRQVHRHDALVNDGRSSARRARRCRRNASRRGVAGRGRWAGGDAGVLYPEGGAGRRRRLPEPGTSGSMDTAGGRRGVGMARQGLFQVAGPRGRTSGQESPGDDDCGEVVMMTRVRWCHQPALATGPGVAGKKRLVDAHRSHRVSSFAGWTETLCP
ncbi:hypothetical protein MRX96_042234 [Rhipicephalus microplus]